MTFPEPAPTVNDVDYIQTPTQPQQKRDPTTVYKQTARLSSQPSVRCRSAPPPSPTGAPHEQLRIRLTPSSHLRDFTFAVDIRAGGVQAVIPMSRVEKQMVAFTRVEDFARMASCCP